MDTTVTDSDMAHSNPHLNPWKTAWNEAIVSPNIPAVRLDLHLGDQIFRWVLRGIAVLLLALLLSIAGFLLLRSVEAVQAFGLKFLWETTWDPVRNIYGALPVVYGTLLSSFLAMLFAAPLSIGIALFLNELASRKIGAVVGFLIEMLAAIPSVVYGLWGIFVLAPFMREVIEPWLISVFGFLPLFQGPAYGVGMLTAGMILAIMVIPTISSISREVFKAIPRSYREAAWGLGATRWETMKIAVLKTGRTGILGAIILGLGRALGETMAVTMVIGNRSHISASLLAPGQTMASVIANEYAEASSQLHLAALAEVGLVLFLVTFGVNLSARLLVWNLNRKMPK